ncbi:baculoviral IAP repeat-containing protein 7-like [Saccostrea cucullata]|uniref:baculoviral IAP repeat-containing protein 7-like n=1 Tax=Saccostrea cuccullata TaxID=36930 RepID=UPI002ECFCCC4
MGFLPNIIQQAIDRINSYQGQYPEITPEVILDEIEKIKNEENVSASKLKRPIDADNIKNITIPQDPEDLRKENHEMRQMLLCKACKLVDISHVVLSCGHMLCEGCLKNLKICWSCKSEIGKVHKVRFDRD